MRYRDMTKELRFLLVVILFLGSLFQASWADAGETASLQALTTLPVKEITVFKDGHAFVLHSGKTPTNESGDIVMDYLPSPVIGTFWPYVSEKNTTLRAVTASRRKVHVERTALNLRELIEANTGSQVIVTEMPVPEAGTSVAPLSYEATIVDIPARSGEELENSSPPYSGEQLPQKGELVLLKTDDGVKVVNFERILDLTFKHEYNTVLPYEEFRNLLTLHLDRHDGGQAGQETEVGIVYLQKGIRWIPSYKIEIDGAGQATVQLQATLINELADMNDVTAHLVIGVPTFAFKDTIDPISLQETVARLSQHFQQDAQTAYAFSNVLTSQVAQYQVPQQPAAVPETGRAIDLGPEVADSAKHEDLFMFRVNHITLKKGQRMVMPIAEFTLKYRDLYSLEIPFTPPPEVWRNFNISRQTEITRLFHAPKVIHKIRLTNDSEYPLTTAPALIVRDQRVLAQGMMTYTAIGAESDLDITTAVDIRVKKADMETKRTPNAEQWHGDSYGRIDLTGEITLTNFGKQPVEVEVIRHVLGNIDKVNNKGKREMVNVFEDWTYAEAGPRPYWWNWFSWPYWWYHFNSIGRITWNVTLEPEKPAALGYTWHYYWR